MITSMQKSMSARVCRITSSLMPWLAQAEIELVLACVGAYSLFAMASAAGGSSPAGSASGTLTPPSSQPGSASASSDAGSLASSQPPGSARKPHRSQVNAEIDRLLAEQKRVKAEKKALANDLKNAQRRRKRLKHKARLLSQLDLLEVMNLRQDEEKTKVPRTGGGAGEPSAAADRSDREDEDDEEVQDGEKTSG